MSMTEDETDDEASGDFVDTDDFLASIGASPTVITFDVDLTGASYHSITGMAGAMVEVEEGKEQDEEGEGAEASSWDGEGVEAEEGGVRASAILAVIGSMGFEKEVDWLEDVILKVDSMGLEEREEWRVVVAKRLAQLEAKGSGLEGKEE